MATKTLHRQKSKDVEIDLVTLSEIVEAVSEGNVESLKKLSKSVENAHSRKNQVGLSEAVYKQSENPLRSTNLIILTCKYNKVKILEYLLSSQSKILDNLSVGIGRACLSPDDKDGNEHNAFYYAIRSSNIEVVDLLIKKWPGNYFANHSEELESIISSAYEELKLKNVALSKEMEVFIETQIIDLRFFSKINQGVNASLDADSIKQRIKLTTSNIELLRENSTDLVDEKFLFVLKFVVQNIHMLKRQLKSTYARLPWEEIEFCSVCFVSSHTKQQDINVFYDATLDKNKIVRYLDLFAKKLGVEMDNINNADVTKLADLPKLNRDQVVVAITGNCPEFEDLYNDFQQIRDVSSLKKINDCITLAVKSDPKQKEGQLLIMRILQVIGEHLKNSLESPKMSKKTIQLFLLSLPSNTRKIVTDLRNSLSHSYLLSKRMQIEADADVKFFTGVLEDVKKVGEVISEILFNNKIKMTEKLLKKFVDSKNFEEMKDVARVLSNVDYPVASLKEYHKMGPEKIEKLVRELSSTITDQTEYEKKLFSDIEKILSTTTKEAGEASFDYFASFAGLKGLAFSLTDNELNDNTIRSLKYMASKTLQNIVPKRLPNNLKQIGMLVKQLFTSVESRISEINIDKVYKSISNIFYAVEFGTEDIRWMESLKDKLSKKSVSVSTPKQNPVKLIREKHDKRLTQKLSELQEILNNNQLNGGITTFTEQFSVYNKDKKLQTVIEMLVLDIMSILSSRKNYLEHNLNFLDDDAPVLIGKALRNHLAHHNNLVEVLHSKPQLAIILNARKITNRAWTKDDTRIGKFTPDNLSKASDKFQRDLSIVTNQQRMFVCLEEGNLEGLKSCIENGADLTARNADLWSTLHFAAKGPSLEAMKFILEENLKLGTKDVEGRTPLHISAANGRKKTVEFLIKEKNYSVEDVDNNGRTPLHLAALNGHKDTVKVLLKYNSDTDALDVTGHSALHHAVKNNHIKTARLLLEREVDVDLNETKGGYTSLHLAAEWGRLDIVNLLLELGANANAKNDNQSVPMHATALNGHLDVVRALIAKGADVNAAGFTGCTSLHNAVETGRLEIAQLLLEHGANVNCFYKISHYTPLHYAAKDGHVEIARTLLEYKANCNAATVEGLTPLHLAVVGGNLKIAVMLLQRGANVNFKDVRGATPLYYVGEVGESAIADLLLKNGAFVDAKSGDNTTPLYVAALKGYKDVVEVLLESNANVNLRNVRDQTALHAAAMNGDVDIMDLLIKKGAEVAVTAKDTITPLQAAAMNGREAAVAFLIKHNADVNMSGYYGMTPLYAAVMGGHKDIVDLLIKHKAKVNSCVVGGSTTLHFAVEGGHREVVEVLIANGADINAECKEGTTPLSLAIKRNRKEIVEVLVKRGADVNQLHAGISLLSMAIFTGYRDIVDILLKNNATVNATQVDKTSALHLAALGGVKNIVTALIKKGAEVNALTVNRETPLHAAATKGHAEVVEELLMNGADMNIKSKEGETPLHVGATSGDNTVVQLLVNHGADIAARDGKNRTALELAVAHGQTEAVKTLLERDRTVINARGNDDWTILHIASQESDLGLVKYLVEQGSDLNARNVHGSKPIHIAAREGFKDAVDFFFEKGMNLNDPGAAFQTLLHYAAMKGHLEVAKSLITKGADVNARDFNGSTPLHIGATFGFTSIVEILLKNGAIYEALDRFSRTPLRVAVGGTIGILSSTEKLFEAVKRNSCEDVERYIKAGAFLDAKNKDHSTPLHYAAWKGFDAISRLLLDNKANPNAPGKKGITPLHYAVKYSHFKIVMDLLTYGAIYDPVSEGGKTPLDLSQDKRITDLLTLVNESFRNVKNGHSKVVDVLKKVNDMDTLKAVMKACDRGNRTLVVAAIHCDFPKVERLKEVAQGDVSTQIKMATWLMVQGNYPAGLSIVRPAYEKRKAILGPDNPGTLDLQSLIAKCVYKQGNYLDSLNMHEEILEKQKVSLGLNHKDTLKTRNGIALIMHRQGRDAEALEIYQEVYAKQKQVLGPDDSDTIESLFHMALVLDMQGKYEEALRANREVFYNRRVSLGPNNSVTISAQNNIAMVLCNMGDHEEAIEIYREVYEKKRAVLGENHADTLRTLFNMAASLLEEKKSNEALKAVQQVLGKQKSALGPDHPDTLNSQYALASVLFEQGKSIAALKAYKECYDRTLAIFGPHHNRVLEISGIMEAINLKFRMGGISPSDLLQNLQNEITVAANDGDSKTVVRLLRGGADVNDSDVEGRTPLHFAASNGHLALVEILLKSEADVAQVTHKGNTPLHSAVSKNHGDVVEALLRRVSSTKLGDLVNARTVSGGNTALHVAAKNGALGVARCLLKHGAAFDMVNKDRKRPVDLAEEPTVVGLLKWIEDLFRYAKSGNVKVVRLLDGMEVEELSAATNARDKDGNTLLRVAMINGHKEVARKLLEVLKMSV